MSTGLAVLSSLGQAHVVQFSSLLAVCSSLLLGRLLPDTPHGCSFLASFKTLVPLRRQRQTFLCTGGQPGSHSKFQDSRGYVESESLVKQTKTKDCSKLRVHHLSIPHLHLCSFPTSYLSKALQLPVLRCILGMFSACFTH